MIDAQPLPPPAIATPAPREVSFGHVSGSVPAGTRRVVVTFGGRLLADRPLRGRTFSLRLELPPRELDLRVTAFDQQGRRSSSVVRGVRGLPSAAAPRAFAPRHDPVAAREIRALAAGFGPTSGIYVEDLGSGRGAAWNAGARFPAGSTLKLAIAVTALRAQHGVPAAGSRLDALLSRMLVHSDNEAANALEIWLAGSTSAGSARVNETMAALGMRSSEMYGGYETPALRLLAGLQPIPIRIESQPAFGLGKYTTAADLARLARSVYLAAGGKGPLPALGVTGSEARYLLWQLSHSTDRGKLDRYLGSSATVLHKAGWIATARHDHGLVVWPGGAFVASVLTWRPGGAGTASDVLAGRVAVAALERFRRIG
jgi:beta-lactamase class A